MGHIVGDGQIVSKDPVEITSGPQPDVFAVGVVAKSYSCVLGPEELAQNTQEGAQQDGRVLLGGESQ